MSAAITVLVPVRGAGIYLQAALDTLHAQGFRDWQAWLCPRDDGVQAALAHAGDDPRIRVAAPAASDAAAIALAAAGVDTLFLCVLDGDDALEPTALAELFALLQAHPDAGMAYSRHVLVDAQGRMLAPGPLCELPYSPDALLLDFMTGPLRLLRTQAFHRAGGYDPTHADAADYDLCLRLSETAAVVHLPQVLYRRRIHPLAPEVARWPEGIEARYNAFVAAVKRRGLDAKFDTALEIDSWHILQPLRPFGGIGGLR